MKNKNSTLKQLNPEKKYSRNDLLNIFLSDNPNLNDGSFQWILGSMLKNGELIKDGYNAYSVATGKELKEYQPFYSEESLELEHYISSKYPYVRFVVFETVLLNEFLNHLIAQNTIFIQVEKDSAPFIFRHLQDNKHLNVMYNPTKKDKDLYWSSNCVIVEDMISETPISKEKPHAIILEKMIVDLYCDKHIKETYSKAEYIDILKQVITTYRFDKTKMFRYARRRGKEMELKNIIEHLEGEDK